MRRTEHGGAAERRNGDDLRVGWFVYPTTLWQLLQSFLFVHVLLPGQFGELLKSDAEGLCLIRVKPPPGFVVFASVQTHVEVRHAMSVVGPDLEWHFLPRVPTSAKRNGLDPVRRVTLCHVASIPKSSPARRMAGPTAPERIRGAYEAE